MSPSSVLGWVGNGGNLMMGPPSVGLVVTAVSVVSFWVWDLGFPGEVSLVSVITTDIVTYA